ncbi:MAG: DUF721 domain-containing protein [Muribaculaceae bacterium]|nr:DUF721 domain-containing protein [Muribaculaceae bacterium]
MKRSEPLHIGTIIEMMKKRVAADPATRRQYLAALWPEIAGRHITAYTSSVRLDGHDLHVYISSASLKEQLGYMREALVKQFNDAAGENAIDNIIFH